MQGRKKESTVIQGKEREDKSGKWKMCGEVRGQVQIQWILTLLGGFGLVFFNQVSIKFNCEKSALSARRSELSLLKILFNKTSIL